MKKILLIAGTRPNFIKLAPLYHRLKECKEIDLKICHTGQHYDYNMSDVFWESLQIPTPDYSLNIKGSFVSQIIGRTLENIGELFQKETFDLVIVFGDVNATVAGAIAAVQSGIKVMHVEAGLRSFDRAMPEEVNRVITDHISNYLMVSENSGLVNLKNEGIADEKVHFVGNIMIENLLNTEEKWKHIELPEEFNSFINKEFAIATFHRPENVDTKENLLRVVEIVTKTAEKIPVILPLHPRTKSCLEQFDLLEKLENNQSVLLPKPLPYFNFLHLVSRSKFVFTDSGGIQEETSHLNIPCVTFRKNTERPITIDLGTNCLMSIFEENFIAEIFNHVNKISSKNTTPNLPLWNNQVSERIKDFIIEKI